MERYRRQSVAGLVSALAAGRADPKTTVAESLAAIAERDGDIRAFVHVDREAADRASGTGPLAGIAVGVKDIFDTADMPTAYGSPIYAGHRPRADAAIVTLLKRAGAAIVGKTATTEFAWLTPTVTRNPNDLTHTPGGSSSGSAAAVAAGMVPAAIGTQTGGSIVRPAAFCGIAGYKPSYRLLPTVGLKHFSPALDTVGLMAATVADVACFAERLTGRPLTLAGDETEVPRLRIGLYRTRLWDQASADMQDAVIEAAERARAAGFDVIEIDEPDELAAAWEAHPTVQDFEASIALGYEIDNHADRLSPALAAHLEAAGAIAPQAYDDARRIAKRGRHACRALFDRCDVLITPSAPGAAPAGLGSTGSAIFNRLWTLMGVPALNVPGLKDATGLPLGLQIVGRFGADHTVLAAGHALETLLSTA